MNFLIYSATFILTLWICINYAGAQLTNQQEDPIEFEQKFQNVIEKLDRLPERLLEQRLKQQNELKEMLKNIKGSKCPPPLQKGGILKEIKKKLSQLQGDIVHKFNTKCGGSQEEDSTSLVQVSEEENEIDSVNTCWNIYTKTLEELDSNFTILQNINKKLGKFDEQYYAESEKHKKSIETSKDFLKFLDNKENSKICIKSDDQKLICADGPPPTSCAAYDPVYCSNGKCLIKNSLYGPDTFPVACDDATDGGSWIVIQRRINGSVDFYRNWSEYKTGFGNLEGEFWIGLDKLHALTSTLAPVELLIQMKDHNDILRYAKYGQFAIGNEKELYKLLEVGDYKGNAGDAFRYHKGFKFTTKDKDNDESYTGNCAITKRAGWWYDNCLYCNLNGFYYKNGQVPNNRDGSGINWYHFHGYRYSLKFVQMMIRTKKV